MFGKAECAVNCCARAAYARRWTIARPTPILIQTSLYLSIVLGAQNSVVHENIYKSDYQTDKAPEWHQIAGFRATQNRLQIQERKLSSLSRFSRCPEILKSLIVSHLKIVARLSSFSSFSRCPDNFRISTISLLVLHLKFCRF